MIERGSGRTSGLTDWRLMDVLSMWACLQDQDTAGQWKQVAGWRKVCDLALTHLSRLREYRRGLAEAWPPETNAAARAYIAELDQLIDRVQRTHDAAAANYDALAAATRAIGSARAELQPLHEEYEKRLRQKRAYEATIADPKAVAGSRLPERPPVTDDDLEQLNVRARGLMTGLSGELQHAQVMLRQPPPKPVPKVDEISTRPGTEVAAPMIPPIIPVPLPATPVARTNPPRTATQTTPLVPAPSTGPILGGVGSTLNPPPTSPTLPSPPTVPSTPSVAGGSPVLPPPAQYPARPVLPHYNQMQGNPASGSVSPASPMRSAPLGGLIGGNIPPGLAQPTSGGPRRVNPVGGVIGGGAAGTAPTGGAGSRPGAGRNSQQFSATGLHPLGGSPTSGSASLGNLGKAPRKPDREVEWDPDNPWRTNEGVDPVVQAPEDEGPIDPGPAIGLPR
ncbi:hypothetical protein MTQ09_16635 [Micromonospora sp. R42106]|nr:hypothetical protein [Micromonospora sp. M42]MCK1807575.1 hypothetical protein [Micromonospora sp. R42106]MCK1832240.1 hypothetical protein [Micromonospora sp. R42003]MCK1844776.1 hypothetical protein [Micromonospora sp. R42004]MCM1018129.1 hypothetical protein [Micromonospora sp. XM-20-01]EWM65984.1 hypothetical protein MCBG_03117 [Micromonospora sp. M42]